VSLGYDVHGPQDAPVVVLGSSLGTTRAMWDEQLPLLAGRFRVVRYDNLGHGESAAPPGPYSVPQLAAELIALLDDLGVERAHHGGLSLGGMVAMQLAATAPERVDRVALVCTSAHMPPAQGWRDRAAAVRGGGMAAVADTVPQRWFTPAFDDTPRADALRKALREVPPEGYAGCCEAIAAMDLRADLAAITAPTLVVAGADDLAIPFEHAETIVAAVDGARLAVVDSAAHLANVEQPEAVTTLLLEHFDRG
jgi:3-oxoadipate enol-lactonase